jgi:hypothetical protein
MTQRAALTIATGKAIYLKMALNLARSFLLWNRDSEIQFFMVVDQPVDLPTDLGHVRLISVEPGSLGTGFAPKLHLDHLAPAEQTLFIDADCLCVGDLSRVFDRFSGHAVSVVGGTITDGEWFGDVSNICAHFNVPCLPKFNGGLYYVEPGPKAASIYGRARALQEDYDRLGLRRLRGAPNDELLIAIAMAFEGCTAVPDDGSIMGDLFACPKLLKFDVFRGKCVLANPPTSDLLHPDFYPPGEIEPLILHFLGHFNTSWQYKAEAAKLRLVSRFGVPVWAAATCVRLGYQVPAKLREELRSALRPAYHRLFGVRKLRPANR